MGLDIKLRERCVNLVRDGRRAVAPFDAESPSVYEI